MAEEKRCDLCTYWIDVPNRFNGECRRNPPQVANRTDIIVGSEWSVVPFTKPDFWCGEFLAKCEEGECHDPVIARV